MIKSNGTGHGDDIGWLRAFYLKFGDGYGHCAGFGSGGGTGDGTDNAHGGDGHGNGHINEYNEGDGYGRGDVESTHITELIINADPITTAYQALIMQTTRGPHA